MDRDFTPTRLLSIQDLLSRSGVKSRSTIYRMMAQRRCPLPVDIGGNRLRWRELDVEKWLSSLPTKVSH